MNKKANELLNMTWFVVANSSLRYFNQVKSFGSRKFLIQRLFGVLGSTFLGCVNNLHTWQFPTGRPVEQPTGRPTQSKSRALIGQKKGCCIVEEVIQVDEFPKVNICCSRKIGENVNPLRNSIQINQKGLEKKPMFTFMCHTDLEVTFLFAVGRNHKKIKQLHRQHFASDIFSQLEWDDQKLAKKGACYQKIERQQKPVI